MKNPGKDTHRRLEIVIRNIEHELPEAAAGTLTIDFEDDRSFGEATKAIASGLKNPLEQALIVSNERGEILGFNPHHYAYHRGFSENLGPRRAPDCRWVLPPRSHPVDESPRHED